MAYGSGAPASGVITTGTPTSMMNYMQSNEMGPLWQHQQMLPQVGNAYGIAQQMLAPGFAMGNEMGGGSEWGDMLRKMLSSRMDSEHPGMPDEQYRQGLRGISGAAGEQEARTMSLLGSTGGGTADPRASAAALSRIRAGVPEAVSNLAAQRSGLDMQAILGMGGLQQPLARQELVNQGQMGQQYGSELRGLAGNIMGSGVYGMAGRSSSGPGQVGTGFMGIPGRRQY